jgi:hypothetical protein
VSIFDEIKELRELAVLVISAAAAAEKTYTKPELREKLKNQIMAGNKGGNAGEWSARKAQMLAVAYKAAGGGYSGGQKKSQKSLKTWGKQDWKTRDGKPAIRKDKSGQTVTARYLPAAKWDKLSDAEAAATDKKKRAGSKTGQFVANTKKAATKSQ